MNKSLFTKQLKKLKDEQRIAHLYLVRHNTQIDLDSFFKELIIAMTGHKIESHPDFLQVKIDEDEKIYKVDSKNIQTFLKFISYHPSNIDHRFVVINDAHLISEVLSNKLLKTFEELNQQTTIILLSPHFESIIPTIKSRSIEIILNDDSAVQNKNIQPAEYKELLKKGTIELEDILRNEIDHTTFNFQSADALLKNIKRATSAKIFHNSESVNLSLLLP